MTVFIKVIDKLYESYLACNPDINIYCSKGVLCLTTFQLTLYLKWDLETCIDAMDLISEHKDITFRVKSEEICFSEDSLDEFC